MSETGAKLRLGTRGSPLALAQAHELRRRLAEAGPVAAEQVEIVVIRTSGDRITDSSLAEAGGKGLFTKELDEALLDGRIDIAVHSAKDLPTLIPPGIAIAGYLPREDARDALIAPRFGGLDKLPAGALIGTASVRREAQLKRWRPDIEIRLMRGNVDTRLRKLAEGECDATLLALAGLKRLGRENEATEILDIARFIPAVGQGAIAIATRTEDERLVSRLAPVLDKTTERALAAERAFLNKLDGSCRTPIAGHAVLAGGRLRFCGLALKQDGTNGVEVSREGPAEEAEQLGADAAGELLARLPPGILAARG
ncbi:MAG: hydroxymethylbilane synthase [Hyphomicrobiales bacterium]|nr:hydroxymethylbilane synthase [Hyphomicrobiales bacterium]